MSTPSAEGIGVGGEAGVEFAFSIVQRRGQRIVLCLHTSSRVPDSAWLELVQRIDPRLTGDPEDPPGRMLVITDGGAPDTRQRAQIGEIWRKKAVRIATIIPGLGNPVMRGVMTALGWLNPAIAFFTPEQTSAALRHVALEHELAELWPEILRMRPAMRTTRTLRRVAEVQGLPFEPAAVARW